MTPRSLHDAAGALAGGRISSRALVEGCLASIDDPAGEGGRVYLHVDRDRALAEADHWDRLRGLGAVVPPFAGVPVSVKDLFDVAGQVTTAGSPVLADQPPAIRDAPAVARLRAAGLIVLGRTNMTEFAFSGMGMNPHHGTPANPWDRPNRRLPGGSTSGGAVSVTDGMAYGTLGTDTGGSCRIPAALCGIVGFKPTQRRVPLDGAVPLSPTLDSIGPLAATVEDCAALFDVLSGGAGAVPESMPVAGLRLAVPQLIMVDGLDGTVGEVFPAALSRLSTAGARVSEVPLAAFADVAEINARGSFPAAESFAWHRDLMSSKAALYDPRVLARIRRGGERAAADYIDLRALRRSLIASVEREAGGYDALVSPTTPLIAPPMGPLETDDDEFNRVNLLMLRNPAVVNLMDGCAVSVPIHRPGTAPVGLMIYAPGGNDDRLLAIARSVAALFPRK